MLITKFGAIPSQSGMLLDGWSYGKKITIPASSIDADLTNFPVTVYLNSSNFDFAHAKADGNDIRFTDKNLTQLKFEKKEYSNTTPLAVFNVQLPIVSNLQDTEIYMWYGNPAAYNASIEAWQDQTGKQLTYNGNVKLANKVLKTTATILSEDYASTPSGYTDNSGNCYMYPSYNGSYGTWSYDSNNQRRVFAGADNKYQVTQKTISSTPAGEIEFQIYTTAYYPTSAIYGIELIQDSNNYYRFMLGNYPSGRVESTRIAKCVGGTTEETQYSSTSVDAAKMYTIKCTWSPEYISLYLDDVLIGSRTTTSIAQLNPTMFRLTLYQASGWVDNLTVKSITDTILAERCASFDGNGDYFVTPSSPDFAFGTNPFTIEFYINKQASSTATWINLFQTNQYNTGTGIVVQFSGDAGDVDKIAAIMGTHPTDSRTYMVKSSVSMPVGEWVHIAVVRNGANGYLFQNGILVGTLNNLGSIDFVSTQPVYIGCEYTTSAKNFYNGSIGGVRITKGRARYTSNYTPPTSFDIDGTDVVFCTNFDTIYDQNYVMVQHMGNTLVDATGNGNNGTATGTTIVSTEYGKARGFDGVGNFISFPSTSLQADNADFTVTFMVNPLNLTGTNSRALIQKRDSDATDKNFHMGIRSDVQGYVGTFGFYGDDLDDNVAHTIGTWYAMSGKYTKSSKEQKIFNDGILCGTRTATNPLNSTNDNALEVGRFSTSQYHKAQFAELITSNIARSDAWIKAETLALKNALVTITDL